jgi:hypothetical protein
MTEKIKIELTKDEALVLFEWLARKDEAGTRSFEDEAEEKVFWAVQAQLEKALVEPFDPKYRHLLAGAKKRLTERG